MVFISVGAQPNQNDKAMDQWQPRLPTDSNLNSCLIEMLLFLLDFRLRDIIFR